MLGNAVQQLFDFITDYQREHFYSVASVLVPLEIYKEFRSRCDGIYIYHPDFMGNRDVLSVFGIKVFLGNVKEMEVKEVNDFK